MYKFILLLFILSSLSYKAQDTIFTSVPETLLVRVLEISSTNITYKSFYNPDGIIRTLANDQIFKICYENGKLESIFQLKQKTMGAKPFSELFIVEGHHIALNNIDITHMTAYKIMMRKDPQTNSEELNAALILSDSRRNGQITFNIIAPTSVVAGIYLARQHRYNDPKERLKARTYFLGGLSACVVSIITAQIYKSLKNKHIRKAALLFNADVF